MSTPQDRFRDWTRGTLTYVVVMGLFDDSTTLLTVDSFSVLIFLALVMQALTAATLLLKDRTIARLRGRPGGPNRIRLGLSVWAIGFFSKFVFLWVLELIFGSAVEVELLGLILVIAAMLAVDFVIQRVDGHLAHDSVPA